MNLFRNKTKHSLLPREKALGDLGYRGERKVITKLNAKNKQYFYAMGCARDCHETVNSRIKTWRVLKLPFRHYRHDHHLFLRNICVIEQIKFENGSPLFQVLNYIDPIQF